MRRHSKASTQRLAVPAIAFCAALAALALIAVPASAEIHPFVEPFGSAAQPSFGSAEGMAVDQSTGDLLVIDSSAGTVSRYNPDGTPADFSALGTNVIDGTGTGDETPQNGLSFGGPQEVQVAVDDSGGPTHGDIYVTQSSNHLIDIFASSGTYLGQLTAAGSTDFGESCGVTVSPSGNVYVGDLTGTGEIHEFTPTANPPVNADSVANFTSVSEPCALAAGSGPTAGFLFASTYGGPVSKLDSVTGELKYVVSSGVGTTVGVDPVSGHVYVAKGAEVWEYDASGNSSASPVSTISLEGEAHGIAVNGTSGDVYVSRAGTSTIDVYGPLSPVAPTITEEATKSVVFTEATVGAKINPQGFETSYHIEYGTDLSYGQRTPDKTVGSDEADHDQSATLENLIPGTLYHWRVVAISAIGPSEGTDHVFTTYSQAGQETSCSNQEFRAGASAALPDCRAYEMVSPVDKNGGDIVGVCNITCYRTEINQSSTDGGKFTYSSYKAFGDVASGRYSSQYMASRGPDGWTTHGISPPYTTGIAIGFGFLLDVEFKAFSPDLSRALLLDSSLVPQTADAIPGFDNLYEQDNADGSLSALTTTEPKFATTKYYNLEIQGHTPDDSHIVINATAALTPDAVHGSNNQLYEYFEGQLHLVSVLPNGAPSTQKTTAGAANVNGSSFSGGATHGLETLDHAIADDGSRIFWSVRASGQSQIYVRLNPDQPQSALNGSGQCTEPANACTIAVSSGPGQFWTADPSGSKALIGEGDDLYTFDVNTKAKTLVAHETLGVLGASDDLSRIYFVSKASLASGATAGERNLYLDSEGAMTYIAALSSTDVAVLGTGHLPSDVNPRPIQHAVRVTPDGRHIAFMSTESLTGYDNTDVQNGEADYEIYVYDADSGNLNCASCNPSGARPQGGELKGPYASKGQAFFDTGVWAAAWLSTSENSLYTPHALSDGGSRLFFNSFDALAPRDTNGAQDVYEWEPPGSGGCTSGSASYAPENGGCVSLISTGQSPERSEFVDATPDGSDSFFKTSSSIDPRDPGLIDVYDARVGGGYPPPPLPPAPCLGDACQSVPTPPNDPTPASAAFRGAGNPAPRSSCPKSKRRVVRKGKPRCVASKQSKRRQHKRRHPRHHRRAAR